jgi:hypothetical protein
VVRRQCTRRWCPLRSRLLCTCARATLPQCGSRYECERALWGSWCPLRSRLATLCCSAEGYAERRVWRSCCTNHPSRCLSTLMAPLFFSQVVLAMGVTPPPTLLHHPSQQVSQYADGSTLLLTGGVGYGGDPTPHAAAPCAAAGTRRRPPRRLHCARASLEKKNTRVEARRASLRNEPPKGRPTPNCHPPQGRNQNTAQGDESPHAVKPTRTHTHTR